MGYDTYYSLNVSYAPPLDVIGIPVPDEVCQQVCDAIEEICEYTTFSYEGGESFHTEETRWSGCTKDMIEVSKRFPALRFELFGDGEESEDVWYEDYVNGKYRHRPGEMVFPDFDMDKLIDYKE